MEHGGPEGVFALFNLYAPEGLLAEGVDRDGSVIAETELEQFIKRR